MEFDLSSLRRQDNNYVASGGNHWYALNVCGPLNAPVGQGCDDAGTAVCQGDLSNSTFRDAGQSKHG